MRVEIERHELDAHDSARSVSFFPGGTLLRAPVAHHGGRRVWDSVSVHGVLLRTVITPKHPEPPPIRTLSYLDRGYFLRVIVNRKEIIQGPPGGRLALLQPATIRVGDDYLFLLEWMLTEAPPELRLALDVDGIFTGDAP